MKNIIELANDNSGFLSLVLFIITIIFTWTSGILKSLIKKPNLKVKFLDKMTFYSILESDENFIPTNQIDTKAGFVLYVSISNIGYKKTTIDKVSLGYKKDKNSILFKNKFQWIFQCNPIVNFEINMSKGVKITLNSLLINVGSEKKSNINSIEVGSNIIGTLYFEQLKVKNDPNPYQNIEGSIDVILQVEDIYGKSYKFKTKLSKVPIKQAIKYNSYFGNVEETM